MEYALDYIKDYIVEFFKSLSVLEWILGLIVLVQVCFLTKQSIIVKAIRFLFGWVGWIWSHILRISKSLFGWIGLFPTLNGLINWFVSLDSIFVKFTRTILSTFTTFLASVAGYRQGYKAGYLDAMNQKPNRWWSGFWKWRKTKEKEKPETQEKQALHDKQDVVKYKPIPRLSGFWRRKKKLDANQRNLKSDKK